MTKSQIGRCSANHGSDPDSPPVRSSGRVRRRMESAACGRRRPMIRKGVPVSHGPSSPFASPHARVPASAGRLQAVEHSPSPESDPEGTDTGNPLQRSAERRSPALLLWPSGEAMPPDLRRPMTRRFLLYLPLRPIPDVKTILPPHSPVKPESSPRKNPQCNGRGRQGSRARTCYPPPLW